MMSLSETTNKKRKVPEGYKQTAVGVIPEEWKVARLADIMKIHVARDLKKDSFSHAKSEKFKFPVYSNTVDNRGFYGGYYDFEEYKGESLTIVGRGAGLGTAFFRDESYGAIGRLLVLFPKKDVNVRFLTEVVNSRLNIHIESTGIPQLTGDQISSYKTPLPPLPEQQKIAAILTTWDEAIEKTQKLIDQLKQRNKGLAQQLLTGKKRLKGFSGEWRKATFGDVAKRISRRNDELNDSVVTISAQRGFMLQEDFFTKRVASETLSHYYLIHKGEFAYNKSYSNGYPMGAFKRLDRFDKAVVTTLYICFSLRENVNSNFMMYFFEAGLMNKGLMKIAQEGGRAHGLLNISLSDFFGLDIYVPELSEQQAIAQVLNQADTELKLYEHKLVTIQQQKNGLMQKLLTGEIRVKTETP